MARTLVGVVLVIVAAVSLAGLNFVTVPTYSTKTYRLTSTLTAVNTEFLNAYSYTTVTCSGSSCYVLIVPFTETAVYSGGTTAIVTYYSVSTDHVPSATAGPGGKFALAVALVVLAGGIVLIVRNRRLRHDDSPVDSAVRLFPQ